MDKTFQVLSSAKQMKGDRERCRSNDVCGFTIQEERVRANKGRKKKRKDSWQIQKRNASKLRATRIILEELSSCSIPKRK